MTIRPRFLVHTSVFSINLLAAVGFCLRGEFDYLFNPAAMLLIYTGILLLERYTAFRLRLYVQICLAIVLLSHTVFGEYYKLYETSHVFDKVLHLFGSFTFTILIYSLMITWLRFSPSHRRIATFLIVVLVGFGVGTVFELIEFAMDLSLSEHNQRSLLDTNLDLVLDTAGSLIAAAYMVKKEPLP